MKGMTTGDDAHPLTGAKHILRVELDDTLLRLRRATDEAIRKPGSVLYRPHGTDQCEIVSMARRAESIYAALDAVNAEIDRNEPF